MKTAETAEPTITLPGAADILVTVSSIRSGSIPVAVGGIDAATITQNCEIPRRDTRKKTGYQRDPSTARINRLAKDLAEGRVDLPTAVLLNLRTYEDGVHLVEGGDGITHFRPNGQELYVVDGQHRILALQKLVEGDPEKWSEFTVPFVCMLGADEREEMRQFYVVNSTAKSVRTDLALDLLKQRAESDPDVMTSLIERGEDWKVKAQTLVEALMETPAWRNRIQMPRDSKGQTTVTSSSFVSSLKPLLGTPYFGQLTTVNQVKILDSFWQGIRKVMPAVFDEPGRYALQKSVGTFVMHGFLVSVLEYIRSKGGSVVDAETYAAAMEKPLNELEGDTLVGEPVRGADFWLAGETGAAGSFSSGAGQRVLIARLRSLLPELEVE